MYLINLESRLLIVGDPSERFTAEVLPDSAVEVPAGSVSKIAKGLEGLRVEWAAEKPSNRPVVELKNKPAAVVSTPAKGRKKAAEEPPPPVEPEAL